MDVFATDFLRLRRKNYDKNVIVGALRQEHIEVLLDIITEGVVHRLWHLAKESDDPQQDLSTARLKPKAYGPFFFASVVGQWCSGQANPSQAFAFCNSWCDVALPWFLSVLSNPVPIGF